MRYTNILMLALSAFLIVTPCPQAKAQNNQQIVTFNAPGAGRGAGQGTTPQQNTDSGAIVGFYVDERGVAHGFIRSAGGKFTNFDAPGAGREPGKGTLAFGITNESKTTGYYFDRSGVSHGFVRDNQGKFRSFDVPNAGTASGQGTLALAINPAGTISGIYVDSSGAFHGFVRSLDGSITSFDPVGSVNTFGDTLGINPAGTISGVYLDANGVLHGYLRESEGAITSFDAPNAGTDPGQGTGASMINAKGTIPGNSIDANGVNHGFIGNEDGTFTTFDVSGAGTGAGQGTIATATNVAGIMTGLFTDANGVNHGFVRSRQEKITSFDAPGAGTSKGQGTSASSINAEGVITGAYIDTNGASHGYLRQTEEREFKLRASNPVAKQPSTDIFPQSTPMTGSELQTSVTYETNTPYTSATLLALYSFNGTLADSSGHGRTAHDSGTPTYVTGAPFGGKAISFDGSGKAIVTAPLNISVAALKQVTFGGWVKALSITTPQYGVISNDDGNFDRTIDIDTRPTGTASWSAFVGGKVVGKVPVVVGKWYFVAVSFDQSTLPGRYAFYVNDGIKTTTLTGTDNFDANSVTTGVTIGRNPHFDQPFNGYAANVFFEHLIMTPTQINNVIVHGPSALP